jgi:tetratricopeptide (TPR) repeat protein
VVSALATHLIIDMVGALLRQEAVGQQQRFGVGLVGGDVQEADALAVDLSGELWVPAELRLLDPVVPVYASTGELAGRQSHRSERFSRSAEDHAVPETFKIAGGLPDLSATAECPRPVPVLGHAYAATGNTKQSRHHFDVAATPRPLSSAKAHLLAARIHHELGHIDAAWPHLDTALDLYSQNAEHDNPHYAQARELAAALRAQDAGDQTTTSEPAGV